MILGGCAAPSEDEDSYAFGPDGSQAMPVPKPGSGIKVRTDTTSHWTQPSFPAGWSQGYEGKGVHIGLVGSGADRNNPALAGAISSLKSYSTDSLANILVTDTPAQDDPTGHETSVAQIMAGRPVLGIPGGLAPQAQIDARQTLTANQSIGTLQSMAAIKELSESGVPIINNSWSPNAPPKAMATSDLWLSYSLVIQGFGNAVRHGALLVQSTGNESASAPSPDALLSQADPDIEKGYIAVTALDDSDSALADYANACGTAAQWCMAAPGHASTITPDSDSSWALTDFLGTSAAAPMVSGAAAVLLSKYPWMTNDNLRQTLLTTADDLGAPGVDAVYGWGRLNAARAMNGPAQFAFGQFSAKIDNGSYRFENVISGTGGLDKDGAGTLALTQVNTYQGPTNVLGGTLVLDRGSIAQSHVSVSPGAKLDAQGKVTVGAVDNAGTVSVAGGDLTINGDFVQGSAATLSEELGFQTVVKGNATLAGTLDVPSMMNGYVPATGRIQTMLRAQSVTGQFSSLTLAPSLMISGTLSATPTSINLTMKRESVPEASLNQANSASTLVASARAVDRVLDAVDSASPDATRPVQDSAPTGGENQSDSVSSSLTRGAAALELISSDAVMQQSLYTLSGALYGNLANQTLLSAGMRQATLFDTLSRYEGARFFAQASGATVNRDPEGISAHARLDQQMIGLVSPLAGLNSPWQLGAAVYQGHTHWAEQYDLTLPQDAARQREVGATLALAWEPGRTGPFAQGGVDWQHFSINTSRTIHLGAQSDDIAGQATGDLGQVALRAGWRWTLGEMTFGPDVGWRHQWLRQGAFREDGSAWGLAMDRLSIQRDTLMVGVGLDWRTRVGTWQWSAGLQAEMERDVSGGAAKWSGAFVGMPQTHINGQMPDWSRTRSRLTGRVSLRARKGMRATLGISRQMTGEGNDFSWQARLDIPF